MASEGPMFIGEVSTPFGKNIFEVLALRYAPTLYFETRRCLQALNSNPGQLMFPEPTVNFESLM